MKRKLKLQVKISLLFAATIIVFILFLFELQSSKNVMQKKTVSYKKESALNYVTYLKNNSHYDSHFLKNEFNLVANLIDYFSLDYTYNYTLDEKIEYQLQYDVEATLEIYDSENDAKPVQKRTYNILDKIKEKGFSQTIKVNIFNKKIIYETYNQIVQEWKKDISPNADLKIVFNVNWVGHSKTLKKDLSDKTTTEFVIPISQKTIDIKTPGNKNEKGVHENNAKLPLWYIIIIIATLILFIVTVINLFLTIFSKQNKSKYESKVNKILREFDRAITEAKGIFIKEGDKNYIEVKDFMELLDVHDNVNEPIIYYKNSENLSVFVIKNGHDIYYSTIKRSDYE